MERGTSPVMEEETDPGLGFAALHRHYALANSYRIKEEPSDNDLLALQELLSWFIVLLIRGMFFSGKNNISFYILV